MEKHANSRMTAAGRAARFMALWLVLLLGTACGCEDQELPINEVLPGAWQLGEYTVEGDEFELVISQVSFTPDGRFTVVYSMENSEEGGRYEAGNDYIRLEYENGGDTQMSLFQVLSFTADRMVLQYKDKEHGITVTATFHKVSRAETYSRSMPSVLNVLS